MASISRRDAGKILLAGCAGALLPAGKLRGSTKVNSVFRGVQIGIQSCSFRNPLPMPLDAIIDAMRDLGIGECELWQRNAMPGALKGEDLTKWRLETPASYFKEIRKKFDDAGILLYAYNGSFRNEYSDDEVDHIFLQAKALGVKYIGASQSHFTQTQRIDKFAQKYNMWVGLHPHDVVPPGEYGAVNLASALEGTSPHIGISLDCGHFTAGGGDAIAFINEHHERIFDLHLKDRRKNHGQGVPGAPVLHEDKGQGGRFGTGDTNIAGILHLVRDKGWKFPAEIELEYCGLETPPADPVTEVKVAFEYCKNALES